MTTKTDELKLCPFCGGIEVFVEPDEIGSGGQKVGPMHVGCAGCKAEQTGDDEQQARANWNRRAQPQPSGPVSGADGLTPGIKETIRRALIAQHDAGKDQNSCDDALNWLATQPQPSGNAPLHPAVREAIEAAFEQREGWMTKIAAAVRYLPDESQPSGNVGELPPLPKVQVPRVDADIDLMDIKRLATWCERTAKDYARVALAQQAAPAWTGNTDADAALIMLDRLDVRGDGDDARVDEIAATIRKLAQQASGQDREDAERWRYMRRKLCLTGNGDGTCAMHAINLPAAIPGWPDPGDAVSEFCDAAIDAACAAAKEQS